MENINRDYYKDFLELTLEVKEIPLFPNFTREGNRGIIIIKNSKRHAIDQYCLEILESINWSTSKYGIVYKIQLNYDAENSITSISIIIDDYDTLNNKYSEFYDN
ncbi:MAG: hypothetical protein GXZ08_00850 [Tissierellia bacterium]|nr:hypothetical protein [Tissierellia bacterium]